VASAVEPRTGAFGAHTGTVAPVPQERKRSLVRLALGLAAVFVCVAVVWVSVGRARIATRSSGEPAKPAAVEIAAAPASVPAPPPIAAPPAEAAPEPPAESKAETPAPPPPVAAQPKRAADRPPSSAPPAGLRVESMLVGASYRGFTCPNPTNRLSVRASRTVNVCLHVAHRPGKADRLALIWERNGAFSGKTSVQLPASRPNVRTRARMKISGNRLGAWSVRLVSDRNAPLAQASFDVVP
jgi:hypothetical protein